MPFKIQNKNQNKNNFNSINWISKAAAYTVLAVRSFVVGEFQKVLFSTELVLLLYTYSLLIQVLKEEKKNDWKSWLGFYLQLVRRCLFHCENQSNSSRNELNYFHLIQNYNFNFCFIIIYYETPTITSKIACNYSYETYKR